MKLMIVDDKNPETVLGFFGRRGWDTEWLDVSSRSLDEVLEVAEEAGADIYLVDLRWRGSSDESGQVCATQLKSKGYKVVLYSAEPAWSGFEPFISKMCGGQAIYNKILEQLTQ